MLSQLANRKDRRALPALTISNSGGRRPSGKDLALLVQQSARRAGRRANGGADVEGQKTMRAANESSDFTTNRRRAHDGEASNVLA
jgi:hypothetical protein